MNFKGVLYIVKYVAQMSIVIILFFLLGLRNLVLQEYEEYAANFWYY